MIHRTGGDDDDSRIYTKTEFLKRRDIVQIIGRLESSFPVRDDTLDGQRLELSIPELTLRDVKDGFRRVRDDLGRQVVLCGTTMIVRRSSVGPCSCRNRGFCRLTTAG